jgi:Tol biopolymer transport system component/predicted Ser/Thr protein kinase
MSVTIGNRLGPYEIAAQIGGGGMGEVYRATDTRLNRSVAIKVAHDQFDERFAREARAIAQLNHPNICTLYDVGPNYLVMELVEGDTLAAYLAGGALPLEQALRYGAQIADALAAAHAKGIVHRDLKPSNIMVTKTGVKVLDFGLAKAPTDETVTQTRAIVGTPAYMAPEQRRGLDADSRSDIYALGLVLREMISGQRAEPLKGVPPHVAHVVERCVAIDPAERWQSASDVKREIEWAATIQETAPAAGRPSRVAWVVAGLACVGMLALGFAYLRRAPLTAPLATRFTMSLEKEIGNSNFIPVPSPTGEYFVFIGVGADGATSLWNRPLKSADAVRLPGTEGADDPIWSPDGRWIAFFADGRLKKISPQGGAPLTIAAIAGFQDAAWGSRGDIIFRPTNREALFRIRDSGGSPQPLTKLNVSLTENSHRGAQFLPDGRRFLFTTRCADRANNALYLGSLDSQTVTRVMPAQSAARYVPSASGDPGSLIFYRDGALLAQPFDVETGTLSGEPIVVVDRVAYNPPSIQARFAVSGGGRVLIVQSEEPFATRMTWINRDGTEGGTLGGPSAYYHVRLAPAGDRVAYSAPDPQTGNRDLFSLEIARGITTRLTSHVANDWFPVWSPDGRRLVFGTDRDGGAENAAYMKQSMDPGSGESRLVAAPAEPYDWSADGHWIVYWRSNDVYVGRAAGNAEPFPFMKTDAREVNPRFSPDAKWIAYSSNESGRMEVYVRSFSGEGTEPGSALRVSSNGGEYSVWGPSGQEIFYITRDSTVFSVDTRLLGRAQALPAPVRLFQACTQTGGLNPDTIHVQTNDGRRFLVNCRVEPPGRFTVLLNWMP